MKIVDMLLLLRFLRFFKSKKHDFLRFFALLHTFSRTLPAVKAGGWFHEPHIGWLFPCQQTQKWHRTSDFGEVGPSVT